VIPRGADAREFVASLRASAETVTPAPGPVPAATAEETEKVLRWLESPGVRLVDIEGEWACPVGGALRHLVVHDAVHQSRLSLVPFDERRALPVVHRP
jgi:DNA polymerase-3 subunit epsilon